MDALMRFTAGELTFRAASASCAFAAGTSAYNVLPTAASRKLGSSASGLRHETALRRSGAAFDPPPVMSLITWSAALSAAAAGK